MHPPICYPEERWDRFQWLGSIAGNKGTHLPWFSIPVGFDESADTPNVRSRVPYCNRKNPHSEKMGINEALALRSIRGMDGWTFEGRRANHLDSGLDRRIHSIRLLLVQKQREEVARWISSSFLQLVLRQW